MSSARTGSLSPIALISFIAAFVALLMVGGAGPAYRLNLVDLGGAFALLRWGAWTGLAVIVIALLGAWITRPGTPSRGFALALAGAVIAGVAFCVPFAMLQSAKTLPPIHDITTDMENPPRFVAIVPLRTGSANPVEYQGESIAQQQRKAYPDIQPVTIAELPDAAFKRALNAATLSFASRPPTAAAASTYARSHALGTVTSAKMPRESGRTCSGFSIESTDATLAGRISHTHLGIPRDKGAHDASPLL